MIDLKVKAITLNVRTRAQRRAAVASVARQLGQIRDAENKCLKRTPDNFAFSANYCLGENAVASIDDALNALGEAYAAQGPWLPIPTQFCALPGGGINAPLGELPF